MQQTLHNTNEEDVVFVEEYNVTQTPDNDVVFIGEYSPRQIAQHSINASTPAQDDDDDGVIFVEYTPSTTAQDDGEYSQTTSQ